MVHAAFAACTFSRRKRNPLAEKHHRAADKSIAAAECIKLPKKQILNRGEEAGKI